MNILKLNIENRLLLFAVLLILFWLTTLLAVLNAFQKTAEERMALEALGACRSQTSALNTLLHNSGSVFSADSSTRFTDELVKQADELTTATALLGNVKQITTSPVRNEMSSALARNAGEISSIIEKTFIEGTSTRIGQEGEFRIAVLLDRHNSLISKLESDLAGNAANLLEKTKRGTAFVFSGALLLLLAMLFVFSWDLNQTMKQLLAFVEKLSRGEIPEKLTENKGDESGQIAQYLNAYGESLKRKIHYLSELSEGNLNPGFSSAAEDRLGTAMMALGEKLRLSALEERKRADEERKRSWNAEGHALFGEIMRSESEQVSELSFRIIRNLVSYLHIEMGTLFLTGKEDGSEEKYLEIIASYAYDRRKFITRKISWGEGLPGTCAREKEKIFLTEIPVEYFEITSGLGYSKPESVLLVPLNLEGEILGIIELAAARIMEPHEILFVENLAQSIASALSAVKNSERTAMLLRQSRQQAEELLRQEEKMKNNMQELELAQNESTKRASEISGILSAINHSSLVAEFAVNGRFLSLNDKFLLLLESPSEQVLGKHHSEFAVVDRYSENYRKFWSSLKNGETLSLQGKYKLYNGREIWLQETFTPIPDSEGKVYKILDIAIDMTRAVEQQESLKKQAAEITRQTLELSSLNDAVNTSIIKCELDTDGIITDLNENFITSSGYNRRELLGRNYRLFLKESEKDQFDRIWTELVKEKTYQGVIRRTRPTGEEIWLMATFSPVRNEEGKIYKIYFLALDITEKKLKYQLLEDANQEIERLKQRLSAFTTD